MADNRDTQNRGSGMLLRHTIAAAVLLLFLAAAAEADPPYVRSGLGGGGHHGLTGGGYHALGGGHHHRFHGGGYCGGGYLGGGYFGSGYYGGGFYGGGYAGFGSYYYGPGFFSSSAPGYSFFSGTTTVLPAPVWPAGVQGGYVYGPPGYFLDPYGPAVQRPGVLETIPADQQAAFDEWLNALDDPVQEMPIEQRPARFVKPSSPAAQVRSIRLQHEGDLQLKNLQYGVAARRYEEAIEAAPDRAEPYFRLAIAAAANRNFTDAVRQLKLGLQLDPDWPRTAPGLEELIGADNLIARTLVKQRVAEWTLEDIRDPDRQFLLGVLLHLDGDDRSRSLFDSAARLGGISFHLAAFLREDDIQQQAQAEPSELPPVPEAKPGVEHAPLLPPLPAP